ncbi:MAG: metallophosphoesterase family protein [Bacteroidota bacterium]
MRLAILSDLHANLEATEAVLAEAETRNVDAVLCLGDVVGYGPNPSETVELVRARCDQTILGNHDAAVALNAEMQVLPKDGQSAAKLHQALLSDDQLDWLASLPYTAIVHGATLAHAAPDHPEAWPRLDSFAALQAQFSAFDTDICFVGHSHKPAVVSNSLGVFQVRPGHRYLIDVGSVGQPRDHDPRAAFAMYDTDACTVDVVRVHYDVARTASKIVRRGLPPNLAERLRRGI